MENSTYRRQWLETMQTLRLQPVNGHLLHLRLQQPGCFKPQAVKDIQRGLCRPLAVGLLVHELVGEHPCRMCPCETAEIFAGSTEVLFICTDCGDMERRARKGAKPKKSKTRRTPAPQPVLNRAQKAEAATRARWAKEQAAHEAKVRKRAQERASGR